MLADHEIGNAKALTLGRVRIKCGFSNPRHSHANCEEIIYLIQGSVEHVIGEETVTASAGDTITIPPGVFHHSTCIGDLDADMIVAYPVGIRDYVPGDE